jgi:hypothetical protein
LRTFWTCGFAASIFWFAGCTGRGERLAEPIPTAAVDPISEKTPGEANKYKHYVNARFGFECDYPGMFVPQGESDNGDGQKFKSKDGKATVSAYGATCWIQP